MHAVALLEVVVPHVPEVPGHRVVARHPGAPSGVVTERRRMGDGLEQRPLVRHVREGQALGREPDATPADVIHPAPIRPDAEVVGHRRVGAEREIGATPRHVGHPWQPRGCRGQHPRHDVEQEGRLPRLGGHPQHRGLLAHLRAATRHDDAGMGRPATGLHGDLVRQALGEGSVGERIIHARQRDVVPHHHACAVEGLERGGVNVRKAPGDPHEVETARDHLLDGRRTRGRVVGGAPRIEDRPARPAREDPHAVDRQDAGVGVPGHRSEASRGERDAGRGAVGVRALHRGVVQHGRAMGVGPPQGESGKLPLP